MDKVKFDAGMRTLVTALNYQISKDDLIAMERVYYRVLLHEGFTDDIFSDCINRFMRIWGGEYGRKFPTVKDFLEAAGKTPEAIASKAFDAVRRSILSVGAYEPLMLGYEHRHAVAHEVVRRLGGWVQVAHGGLIDFDSKREKFIRLYTEMYYQPIKNKPLMGMIEQKNNSLLDNADHIAKIRHSEAQELRITAH